jgi:uncharacterized protein (TIGR04206 family)
VKRTFVNILAVLAGTAVFGVLVYAVPVEAKLMTTAGVLLLALATLFLFFTQLVAYPLAAVSLWVAATLIYRGYKLRRRVEYFRQIPR